MAGRCLVGMMLLAFVGGAVAQTIPDGASSIKTPVQSIGSLRQANDAQAQKNRAFLDKLQGVSNQLDRSQIVDEWAKGGTVLPSIIRGVAANSNDNTGARASNPPSEERSTEDAGESPYLKALHDAQWALADAIQAIDARGLHGIDRVRAIDEWRSQNKETARMAISAPQKQDKPGAGAVSQIFPAQSGNGPAVQVNQILNQANALSPEQRIAFIDKHKVELDQQISRLRQTSGNER